MNEAESRQRHDLARQFSEIDRNETIDARAKIQLAQAAAGTDEDVIVRIGRRTIFVRGRE
jgi:hypothetical protein